MKSAQNVCNWTLYLMQFSLYIIFCRVQARQLEEKLRSHYLNFNTTLRSMCKKICAHDTSKIELTIKRLLL